MVKQAVRFVSYDLEGLWGEMLGGNLRSSECFAIIHVGR